MVVGQVVAVYPPYRGGIGTVAAEYTRALAARGIDVRVFHPENTKSWYRWGHAALIMPALKALRGVDVIHLHYPFYGGEVVALLASVLWRKPLVVTYHMRAKASGWVGWIMRLHRWFLEPLVLWRAKTVFVASAEYAEEHGIRHPRLQVVPFGVDTARFAMGRDDEFRRQHGISPESTVLLFVGGMDDAHYFKGVDVLLKACTMLEGDWTLLLVGSGNRQEGYTQMASELGIVEKVRFVGSVPYEELPRAYRAADVHVLPSIDRSEAFGLVTLEAAATGIPSVVSDLPGMRSLVLAGETGLHVRPNDAAHLAVALQELLQQDGRREMMGAAARARAEKCYSREQQMDHLVKEYENWHRH